MTAQSFGEGGQIGVELYKSLRAEEASYLEKVPALWLQKFTLVGAMIAFVLTKYRDLTPVGTQGGALLIAAVCAIPVLAILLDAKILEYGLHARAISRFVHRHTETGSVEASWEAFLWGDKGDARDLALVRLRSAMTVIVTAVPTSLIIILAGCIVGSISPYWWQSVAAGSATAIVYIAGTVVCARQVWPSA